MHDTSVVIVVLLSQAESIHHEGSLVSILYAICVLKECGQIAPIELANRLRVPQSMRQLSINRHRKAAH